MTNKKFKKDYFAELLALVEGNEELTVFIENEIALLNKKSASAKTPTARQIENEGLKAEIVTFLSEVDSPKCIKEIQAGIASLEGLTNQRITHLLSDLVKNEVLTKEYVKKVPYFAIA